MTRVLLITDSERVQRVSESLRGDRSLQLTFAGTLSEGDEEISAAVPDSVFLQSRISGFSGEIVMRHLKKTLPATTKVTLLAVDPEDAAQAKKRKIPVVELWADDEGLKDQLTAAVTAGGRKTGTKGRVADRRKTRRPSPVPAPAEEVRPAVPGPPAEEAAVSPAPPADAEAPAPPGQVASIARVKRTHPADELFTEATEPAVEERPGGEAEEIEPEPEATTFAELMRRAAAKRAPATAAEVEDRVQVGGAQAEAAEKQAGPAAARPETAENAPTGFVLAEPTAPSGFVLAETPAEEQEKKATVPPPFVLAEEPEEQQPAGVGGFARGESVAEAYLRTKEQKPKRPYWILPVAAAALLIPVLLYYYSRHHQQPPKLAQQPGRQQPARQQPAPASAAPARAPAPAKAPSVPAAPAPAATATTKPSAPPAARQAPPVGQPRLPAAQPRQQAPAAVPVAPRPGTAPAASPATPPAKSQGPAQGTRPPQPAPKPVQKGGLNSLPPFISEAKVDPAYGKSHPGWVRYIGPRAQYRLFREGNTFKALQVIPLGGGTIPDQLYQRALLEFGGIDSYQVQSSDTKGNYLVEKGVAKGGVWVTIYRNKSDLGMKGLVIYYR